MIEINVKIKANFFIELLYSLINDFFYFDNFEKENAIVYIDKNLKIKDFQITLY